MNMDEVEALKQKIEILEQTIRQLRKQLSLRNKEDRQRYEQDSDYVPYHELEDK